MKIYRYLALVALSAHHLLASAGSVWVSDTAGRVHTYDSETAELLQTFGQVVLDNPLGIAISAEGKLFVASNNSNRDIAVFSAVDGKSIGNLTRDATLSNAALYDLALSGAEGIFVALPSESQIRRYSTTTGMLLQTISLPGASPVGLAFGTTQDLFVSSANDNRILRLNTNSGEVLQVYTSSQLVRPAGLAVDRFGSLFAASQFTDSVIRFDIETGSSAEFTTGVQPRNPNGVTFGPDGNLYVTSLTTSSVLRFNGETGIFIDNFIVGSGELSQPAHLVFSEFTPSVPEPSAVMLFVIGFASLAFGKVRTRNDLSSEA